MTQRFLFVLVAGLSVGVVTRADEAALPEAEARQAERRAWATFPNKPAGFDYVIAESPMNVAFEGFPGTTPSEKHTGTWWQSRGQVNTQIVEDAEAPISPDFMRFRYPEGHPYGVAAVDWGGRHAEGFVDFDHIYLAATMRLVDTGTGDWESHRAGTKLGFFGGALSPASARTHLYPFLQGGTRDSFTIRMNIRGPVLSSAVQNVKFGPVMRVGEWHLWEMEMIANDIGENNGVLRWWIDGELIMEHTDVIYRDEGAPLGFYAWRLVTTWGGVGGPAKSRDDFVDVSHVYISTAAQPDRSEAP